ncbi:MAG: DUF547 domain-containing protein [Bacteroidota bacterium]
MRLPLLFSCFLAATLLACGGAPTNASLETATTVAAPTSETTAQLDVKTEEPPAATEVPPQEDPEVKVLESETVVSTPLPKSTPEVPTQPTQATAPTTSKKEPKLVEQPKPAAPAPAPEVTETSTPPAASPPTAPAASPTPETTPVPKPAPTLVQPDHANFNALLQQYVNSSGNVNYAGFKRDEAKLDAYLAELAQTPPTKEWSRNASMAYWINAYNAGTIKLILKNWPVKSIMDIHGGKPWDVKWIKLGQTIYSLNQIEHDIIRPRYQDARIHFAVNCAATSCPPLPNKAFTADNLNALLTSRTRAFIRSSAYNTITESEVKISKIFDWYGDDFGDLRSYLNKYLKTPIAASTKINFREYDWALNKQ